MNHATGRRALAALLGLAAACTTHAQSPPMPSRGELLYTTHCVSCHTTQMHWRDSRQAVNWDSLTGQVRRWQGNAGLAWNDDDIEEVSRYLNDGIYRYPQTSGKVALSRPNAVCVSAQTSPCGRTKVQP